MATRLPIPGDDAGQWGQILNDFLNVSHGSDGTLKPGAVTATALGAGAVSTAAMQDGSVAESKLDAGLTTKVNATASTTLQGDVTGPTTATVVDKVAGVAVTGAPTPGQVLKATSATAASWANDLTGTVAPRTVVTATSDTTAQDGQYIVASGAITITLPAAAVGLTVTVKKTDATTLLTVATPGAATIDGSSNDWTSDTQWVSQDFICDGSNWYLV